MSSEATGFWPPAIVMLGRLSPGRSHANRIGKPLSSPPRNTAIHTWMWMLLTEPSQVRGERRQAATTPPTHCTAIKTANIRSVRQKLTCWPAANSSAERCSKPECSKPGCSKLWSERRSKRGPAGVFSGNLTGRPQGTAKHRGPHQHGRSNQPWRSVFQYSAHCIETRVIAGVAPPRGDAAGKAQLARRIVEQHLAGYRCSEALHLAATWIGPSPNTGDSGGSRPQRRP